MELPMVTAALTVVVAVADLISNAGAFAQAWTPLTPSALGVDLTGIALGVVFSCFARATARRARTGGAHSAWALPAVS